MGKEVGGILDFTPEEAALVADEHIAVVYRPRVMGTDRPDYCRPVATAGLAIDIVTGKKKLEIEVFGKALYEAVSLGQAGAAQKHGLQSHIFGLGHRSDHLGGVPVLLDEGRLDAELGRDRVEKIALRQRVRRLRICRRNRSCARGVP